MTFNKIEVKKAKEDTKLFSLKIALLLAVTVITVIINILFFNINFHENQDVVRKSAEDIEVVSMAPER